MSIRIVVHGWGVKGPTFDVETRRTGFKHRRNRYAVKNYGSTPNARLKTPAHHMVLDELGEPSHVLFNRGFVYEAHVLVDAVEQIPVHVDAREGYGVLPLAPGVDLLSVTADGVDDSDHESLHETESNKPVDDNDDPGIVGDAPAYETETIEESSSSDEDEPVTDRETLRAVEE